MKDGLVVDAPRYARFITSYPGTCPSFFHSLIPNSLIPYALSSSSNSRHLARPVKCHAPIHCLAIPLLPLHNPPLQPISHTTMLHLIIPRRWLIRRRRRRSRPSRRPIRPLISPTCR